MSELTNLDTSFNLTDEYKPEPLVPEGTYFGSVSKVYFDGEKMSLVWTITLNGNEGVLSDGETPIDGATVRQYNWFPRPGDESTPTASGRSTKRQAKINMLKRFADDLSINLDTPTAIQEALDNQEWLGMDVKVVVGIREYEGNLSNEVKKMTAA